MVVCAEVSLDAEEAPMRAKGEPLRLGLDALDALRAENGM